jgi:hypothetical protein
MILWGHDSHEDPRTRADHLSRPRVRLRVAGHGRCLGARLLVGEPVGAAAVRVRARAGRVRRAAVGDRRGVRGRRAAVAAARGVAAVPHGVAGPGRSRRGHRCRGRAVRRAPCLVGQTAGRSAPVGAGRWSGSCWWTWTSRWSRCTSRSRSGGLPPRCWRRGGSPPVQTWTATSLVKRWQRPSGWPSAADEPATPGSASLARPRFSAVTRARCRTPRRGVAAGHPGTLRQR